MKLLIILLNQKLRKELLINMIDLNTTELQCIRRALKDFIKSKENSVYAYPYYIDIHTKIQNAIYSKENKSVSTDIVKDKDFFLNK